MFSCKFAHPGEDSNTPMKLTFCGQFQKGQCTFRNCHYVHAEKDVEQDYLRNGETLSSHFNVF